MRYSVFNSSLGNYSVYEGPVIFPTVKYRGSSLGSVPDDVTELLPGGSVFVGESDRAQGTIVEREQKVGEFAATLLLAFPAYLLVRWFLKRG